MRGHVAHSQEFEVSPKCNGRNFSLGNLKHPSEYSAGDSPRRAREDARRPMRRPLQSTRQVTWTR